MNYSPSAKCNWTTDHEEILDYLNEFWGEDQKKDLFKYLQENVDRSCIYSFVSLDKKFALIVKLPKGVENDLWLIYSTHTQYLKDFITNLLSLKPEDIKTIHMIIDDLNNKMKITDDEKLF